MNTVSEFTVRRSFLRLRHSTSLRLHPEAGRDSIFFGWTVLAPDWRGLIPNSLVGKKLSEWHRTYSGFRYSITVFAVWRRACGFPH